MKQDQDLAARLSRGDRSALEQLMDQYGNLIRRTAFLLLRDHHLSEDISQEVFIAAYRKIKQYSGQGSLQGWLLKITVNLCRNQMRKASWKRLIYRDVAEQELISIDSELAQTERRHTLLAHIHSLPYKYREAITLRYYHDMSVKDIAQLLGEKEGTVKSKLSRGRGQLKTLLVQSGWHDAEYSWDR